MFSINLKHMVYIVNIFPGKKERSRVQWLKDPQLHISDTFCALWQKLDEAVCPTSKPACVYIIAAQIGQIISSGICMHPEHTAHKDAELEVHVL